MDSNSATSRRSTTTRFDIRISPELAFEIEQICERMNLTRTAFFIWAATQLVGELSGDQLSRKRGDTIRRLVRKLSFILHEPGLEDEIS